MGFDIYGLNPKENTPKPAILSGDVWKMEEDEKKEYFEASDKWEAENPGTYFRNNVWWWRPLWSYVCQVCEDVMSPEDMGAGGSNSGYKISESTVDRMVEKLVVEIALDNHKKHEEAYMESIKNLPKEDCTICDATGKRKEPPLSGAGESHCNGCDGTGKKEAWDSHYPFSAKNVEEFVNFLSESGGIEIL